MESSLKSTFLICGYPRSRTLWLAKFFSIPGISVCEHEATQFVPSSDEFWNRAESFGMPIYGNSDSAMTFVLPAVLAARPLTKVVWIERPIAEVVVSMRNAGFPMTAQGADLLVQLKERSLEYFDLVIGFKELERAKTVRELWEFLLPDQHFDYGYWGQLANQRIAYTYEHYQQHPRRSDLFLNWIAQEGEVSWLVA